MALNKRQFLKRIPPAFAALSLPSPAIFRGTGAKGHSLYLPAHIKLNVNSLGAQVSRDEQVKNLQMSYHGVCERHRLPFKEAMFNAANRALEESLGRPLVLCVSGLDSLAIGLTFNELNIPYTPVFMSLWGSNLKPSKLRLSQKVLKKSILVHEVSKKGLLKRATVASKLLKAPFPTHIALTEVFDRFSESYIIVGEGDLNKLHAEAYSRRVKEKTKGESIPFNVGEISYRSYSTLKNLAGEFYFYSSTPELLSSVYFNPLFNKRRWDVAPLIIRSFPELRDLGRYKNLNWTKSADIFKAVKSRAAQVASYSGEYFHASLYA